MKKSRLLPCPTCHSLIEIPADARERFRLKCSHCEDIVKLKHPPSRTQQAESRSTPVSTVPASANAEPNWIRKIPWNQVAMTTAFVVTSLLASLGGARLMNRASQLPVEDATAEVSQQQVREERRSPTPVPVVSPPGQSIRSPRPYLEPPPRLLTEGSTGGADDDDARLSSPEAAANDDSDMAAEAIRELLAASWEESPDELDAVGADGDETLETDSDGGPHGRTRDSRLHSDDFDARVYPVSDLVTSGSGGSTWPLGLYGGEMGSGAISPNPHTNEWATGQPETLSSNPDGQSNQPGTVIIIGSTDGATDRQSTSSGNGSSTSENGGSDNETEYVEVPAVSRQALGTDIELKVAIAKLEGARLTWFVPQADISREDDRVFRQHPPAGTRVPIHSSVELLELHGKVPNVVGQTLGQAYRVLHKEEGFHVEYTQDKDWKVTHQSEAAGSYFPKRRLDGGDSPSIEIKCRTTLPQNLIGMETEEARKAMEKKKLSFVPDLSLGPIYKGDIVSGAYVKRGSQQLKVAGGEEIDCGEMVYYVTASALDELELIDEVIRLEDSDDENSNHSSNSTKPVFPIKFGPKMFVVKDHCYVRVEGQLASDQLNARIRVWTGANSYGFNGAAWFGVFDNQGKLLWSRTTKRWGVDGKYQARWAGGRSDRTESWSVNIPPDKIRHAKEVMFLGIHSPKGLAQVLENALRDGRSVYETVKQEGGWVVEATTVLTQ